MTRLLLLPFFVFLSLVYYFAWVSEDAFIFGRYVDNFVNGYGLVFNIGERVQGFTSPLYTLLLIPFAYFTDNFYLLSLIVNFSLSLSLLLIIFISVRDKLLAPTAAFLLISVLISSHTFLTFQTSGLENSLSHCFILLLLCCLQSSRYLSSLIICSLLLTCRNDLLFLIWPVIILLYRKVTVVQFLFSFTPLVLWKLFTFFYYGSLFPNTAYAKLAIDQQDVIAKGLSFFADYFQFEPLPCFFIILLAVFLLIKRKHPFTVGVLLGGISYVAYVVYIGGDFMRGRPLTVLLLWFVAAAAFQIKLKSVFMPLFIFFLALLSCYYSYTRTLDDHLGNYTGIHSEWYYYKDLHLTDVDNFQVKHNWAAFGRDLKKYADKCGPFSIHIENVGIAGYFAGPQVTIIDYLGLTDAFVARTAPQKTNMAGHVKRKGLAEYYLYRDSIRMRQGWEKMILNLDCQSPRPYEIKDITLSKRLQITEKLISGPVFDLDRFLLIVKNIRLP